MSERSSEYLGSVTATLTPLAVRDGAGDIARDAVVVTMYGGVMMFRAYCVDCRKNAFVEGGRLVCCLEVVNPTRIIQARIATKSSGRDRIADSERDALVALQGGLCFYCDRVFWSEVYRGVRSIVLRPNVDHFVPYVYSQSDLRSNKVAACHVCNAFKNAIVLIDTDAAREYLALRWRKKGYRDAE
jgi:5-methylcytosine-specific restriction endonuclease McrA